MGLFSSKKKTKVATTVQRVIEDNQLPETVQSGVLKYILKDGNQISSYILNGLVDSLAIRADRMYRFAEKGNYFYGLPKATVLTSTQGRAVVQQTIEAQLGESITLDYYEFAPLNSIHVAWEVLMRQYGYNPVTNEIQSLSAQEGFPVYLEDMVAVYSQQTFDEAEPGVFSVWGDAPNSGYTPERAGVLSSYVTPTPYKVSATAITDSVEVHFVYQPERPEPKSPQDPLVITEPLPPLPLVRGVFSIPIEDTHPDEDGEYHHVRYRTASGQIGYWTYRNGSGELAQVDSIYKTDFDKMGTYFPWIYYRHDKQNRVHEEYWSTEQYKSSKKLCKIIGMDYLEIGEAINSNPDIGDIEQAMMIMAVAANSEDQIDLKYLYEYFSVMYYTTSGDMQEFLNNPIEFDGFNARASHVIDLRDKEFRMILRFQGIARKRRAGVIGPIGHYSGEFSNVVITEKYTDFEGMEAERTIKNPYHSYCKQVTKGFYEEIRVYGLKVSYDIWRGKMTSAMGESENLLVPLDRSVVGLFSLPEREMLYSRSLHNIFNTRITTKTKWYQSGWFKVVMIVVSVGLTILYPPGGAAMWATIAAMGTMYLVIAVLTVIVTLFAISQAIQLFAEVVGAEWAMVVAVVLIAYGGGQAFSKAGTISLEAVKSAVANNFVQLGTNLAKAGMGVHQAERMEAYNQEVQEFELFKETQIAELEEVRKLLDMKSLIDPFEFIGEQPLIIWGESPQDMYSRTVHSGNIGIASLDVIPQYVQQSLTLPKITESLMDLETLEA